MILNNFDATQFNPVMSNSEFVTPKPNCVLMGKVINVRQQANKNGTGVNTFADIEILGSSIAENDQYIGSKVSICFALQHQNHEASEIAHRRLANLIFTLGLRHINDETELYDIPFMFTVTPQKQQGVNGQSYVDFNTFLNQNGEILISADGSFGKYQNSTFAPHVAQLLSKMNSNVGMAEPPMTAQPQYQQPQQVQQPQQQWGTAPAAPWGN